MPKILVAEDNHDSREFLVKYLKREGYDVLEAANGEEALCHSPQADLLLIDVNMPILNGWEVVKILRQDYPDVPIIMLTALASVNDQVQGFELGVDDYVTKPYDLRALGLRIKALFRRSGLTTSLEYKDLKVLVDTREVFLNDQLVVLTKVEYELLVTLAQNPGRVFSRERLLERIWGSDYEGMDRVVDVRMVALRKKIGEEQRELPLIETVRGLGYRFKSPISEVR